MEQHDQIILDHIMRVWRGSGVDVDRVWVARYAALGECAQLEVATPLMRTWLLDKEGIRRRSCDEYARFWACHIASSLASHCAFYDRTQGEHWGFGLGRYFQVEQAGQYCVEVMLHGKWGYGDVWRVEGGKLEPVRSLWMS